MTGEFEVRFRFASGLPVVVHLSHPAEAAQPVCATFGAQHVVMTKLEARRLADMLLVALDELDR